MKLYHFALFFAVISCGCMIAIQVTMLNERKKAELRQAEYDCLASAADDMAEVLFTGKEDVSLQKVALAGDIFFQSLSLCRNGVADVTTEAYWKQKVDLTVYETNGYYRFQYVPKEKGIWEFCPYGEAESVPAGRILPSVVAILGTDGYDAGRGTDKRICAVSGCTETMYYVTESGTYHVPGCDACKKESVKYCYATPLECAQNGAFPCKDCLK